MKVALVGYFGHDNLGDEAILLSVLQQLKRYNRVKQITVFSANPQETKKKYSVLSLNRKSFPDIIAGISMSDYIIFAGGTLIQDKTSFASLLYYLGIILLSRTYGKKVILYSQGIEPLKYPISRWIVAYVLHFVHYISVRDEESIKYLQKTLKLQKRVNFTVDSALMLAPYLKNNLYKGLIGLNFMGFTDFPIVDVAQQLEKFAQVKNIKYLYLSLHPEDERIGKELQLILGDDKVVILEKIENIAEFLGVIAQLDMLVGARLHSLILSASVHVPFLGIHYHDKVESFSKEVKQKYISFNNLQKGMFYSNLEDVYEGRNLFQNQLKYLVENLKEKSKDNLINNILVKYEKF